MLAQILQVRSAAELKSREELETSAPVQTFKFKEYMLKRAELVNQALDKAVPLQYPEEVTEAMRCSPLFTMPPLAGKRNAHLVPHGMPLHCSPLG